MDNPYESPKTTALDNDNTPSGMFANLFELEFNRNFLQALGFYIVYFIIAFVIGMFAGTTSSALIKGDPQIIGFVTGVICAIVICVGLAIAISAKKGILSSAKGMLLVVLTLISAGLLGALGGLIPVAYLTTHKR